MTPPPSGRPIESSTVQAAAVAGNPSVVARPSRRRRRLHRLFGVGVASLLLIGQEFLFRAMFPLPEVEGFNRIRYQMLAGAHPNLRMSLKHGLVYDRLLLESQPDGFSEIHRLNLYGFRGSDFAIDRPGDRRRILVIGDSVAEGQGAPESATIPAELARLISGQGTKAEVVNLGVIAASLPHLTALTRDAVAVLDPDGRRPDRLRQ